jgi:hypothetical protein
MQHDTRAPTLAHDLRALAYLYVDVARLMVRRVTHRSSGREARFYPPVLVVRPDDRGEPEDMIQAAERLSRRN